MEKKPRKNNRSVNNGRKTAKQYLNHDNVRKAAHFSWASVGYITLAWIIVYAIIQIKSMLTPFILAMILVYVLRPAVDYFTGKGLNRTVSLILVYFLMIVTVLLAGVFIVPVLFGQFKQFALAFPGYLTEVNRIVDYWQVKILNMQMDPAVIKSIEGLSANTEKALAGFFSRLPSAGMDLIQLIFNLVLAPILAFYLLKDFEGIKENVYYLINPCYREEAKKLLHEIDTVLSGFIKGQLIIAFIVGFLSWIAFLVIGIDYALVIAIITGFLNVIPYFGPIFGGLIASVVALFKAPILVVWVVISMLAVHQIDSFFLSPYIMGKQVKLHPVLIVFALFLGGYLFGIMGMLLAIPVAAVGKVMVYHYLEQKRRDVCDR